jgi:hypothetical protein
MVAKAMHFRTIYPWAIAIALALVSAALIAGANFPNFLITLAGILVLGFALRELEQAKRARSAKRSDEE